MHLAMEMRKIREHVNLVYQHKARTTRRNTYSNSSTYADERNPHRRARSADRRYLSRTPPPVYTVEEWEEERRRPHKVDPAKAQRDSYYAHALPSPYKGEIEYTPDSDELEGSDKDHRERRHRHGRSHGSSRYPDSRSEHYGGGSRAESYRSRSSSTTDRGRTRSRSVHTEQRVVEESSEDADSEAETVYSRRRDSHYTGSSAGRSDRAGRGR